MPISLVTSVVLARFLGASSFGLYSILANFTGIAVLLSMFGWPTTVVYRIRRVGVPSNLVAGTGIAAMMLVSAFCVALGLILEGWITRTILGGVPIGSYRIALLLIPIQLYGRLFVAIARALDRFDIANRYVLSVVAGTLLVSIAVMVAGNYGLFDAMIALGIVHFLATSVLAASVLSKTGVSWSGSAAEGAESARYSIKSYLQAVSGQLHEQIDVLMLATFSVDPAKIATYAIAVGIVNRLKIVPEAISGALFPHVSGLPVEDGATLAARATRHSTAWAWAMAVGLGLVAPWLVPMIFGVQYSGSVAPILILLPGVALLTTYMVLTRFYMGIDRHEVIVRTQLASLVLNIALNCVLIPSYGILGSAFASLISYGVEMALVVYVFMNSSNKKIAEVLLLSFADLRDYRSRWDEFTRSRTDRGASL